MTALPDSNPDSGEHLNTGLLPIICRMIAAEPGCNIVDLGAVSTGKCAFFSMNGSRVFIDTSGNSLRAHVVRGGDINEYVIDRLLAQFPAAIDVILFWNLVDYLSLDAIKPLMQGVSRRMRRGGLAYIMASRLPYIPRAPAVIDVVGENVLRFQSDTSLTTSAPEYAPKKLEQAMPGFVLQKLYLLQNGIQEHLFRFEGTD